MTTTTELDAQEVTMPGWGGARPGAGRPAGSDLVPVEVRISETMRVQIAESQEAAGDKSLAAAVRRLLDEAMRLPYPEWVAVTADDVDQVRTEVQVRRDQRAWLDQRKAADADQFRSVTLRRALAAALAAASNGPQAGPVERADVVFSVRRDQLDWLDRVSKVSGERDRSATLGQVLDEARRVQVLRDVMAAAGQPERVLAQHVLDILDGRDTITAAE